MEIRCPKCKYKFEEEIAPGILEKACVCPRCGTPFIYNVENEDDKNGDDEINSNVDNLYSQNTTTSNDNGKKLHTSQYNGRSSKAKRSNSTSSLQDRYADLRMLLSGKAKLNKKSDNQFVNRKEVVRTIIFAVTILFVVVIVVTRCVNNVFSNYDDDRDNDESTLFERTNVDNTTSIEEESRLISDDYKWIEGSWSTPRKDIEFTFSIRGNQISITDGQDYAVNGKYSIKGDTLLFNNYVFKLDKTNDHIIFDNVAFEQSHFY